MSEDRPGFWRLAPEPSVVRRACGYALGVGALRIAIDHGAAPWRGELTPGRWLRMGLTVLVPYGVSSLSSVGARRRVT